MKEFLINNWPTILIVAILFGWTLYLVIAKKWEQLRHTAYYFIMQAERAITGTKKGKEKFEVVFAEVYNLIPPWLRLFFPEPTVREQLQKWYNYIKDYLDDGKVNNSV